MHHYTTAQLHQLQHYATQLLAYMQQPHLPAGTVRRLAKELRAVRHALQA